MPARIPIPEGAKQTTPKKAEVLGYLAAEGEVIKRGRLRRGNDRSGLRLQREKYLFFNNTNPVMIERFQKDIEDIYESRPFYDERKKRCTVKRVAIIEDIERYGKFTSAEWFIPSEVRRDSRCLSFWLRAFFDGDGYVENDKKWGHKRIVLFSKNLEGLFSIKKALQVFGVVSIVYPKTHKLIISRSPNLTRFKEQIGFTHPRKKKALGEILERG